MLFLMIKSDVIGKSTVITESESVILDEPSSIVIIKMQYDKISKLEVEIYHKVLLIFLIQNQLWTKNC